MPTSSQIGLQVEHPLMASRYTATGRRRLGRGLCRLGIKPKWPECAEMALLTRLRHSLCTRPAVHSNRSARSSEYCSVSEARNQCAATRI